MSNFSVAVSGTTIHNLDNLYSLNDLHKASGSLEKHKPANWLRNKQTTDLIAEIEIAQIRAIVTKQGLGTFVCKELVVHYGMWISPQFSLKVIHAFLATQEEIDTITPEQQQILKQAVIDLSIATGEHFQHIYGRLFREFKIPRHRELLAKDFEAALEYLSKPISLPAKPSLPLQPITMPRLGNGLHPRSKQEFINAKSISHMRESMKSPIRQLLIQLKEFDYDTYAIETEFLGMRDLIERYQYAIHCINGIADREPSLQFFHK